MKVFNESEDGKFMLTITETDNNSFTLPLLEIKLKSEEDFLKVVETLTRIGIVNRKEQELYQSCHILHKRGHYFLVHFKEMFALDGRNVDLSDEDITRRNYIAGLLEKWGLITVSDESSQKLCASLVEGQSNVRVFVLAHSNKKDYKLKPKYNMGIKRKVA